MPPPEHRDHDHTRWLDFLRVGFAEEWEDVFLAVMADVERERVARQAVAWELADHDF